MSEERPEHGDWITPLSVTSHAVAWAGVCGGLYYYVPWYKHVFQDFGVELSRGVIFLINLSDFVVNFFYLLIPVFGLAIALDAAIAGSFKSRISRVLWLILMLVLPLSLIVLGIVFISTTMRPLMERLSMV